MAERSMADFFTQTFSQDDAQANEVQDESTSTETKVAPDSAPPLKRVKKVVETQSKNDDDDENRPLASSVYVPKSPQYEKSNVNSDPMFKKPASKPVPAKKTPPQASTESPERVAKPAKKEAQVAPPPRKATHLEETTVNAGGEAEEEEDEEDKSLSRLKKEVAVPKTVARKAAECKKGDVVASAHIQKGTSTQRQPSSGKVKSSEHNATSHKPVLPQKPKQESNNEDEDDSHDIIPEEDEDEEQQPDDDVGPAPVKKRRAAPKSAPPPSTQKKTMQQHPKKPAKSAPQQRVSKQVKQADVTSPVLKSASASVSKKTVSCSPNSTSKTSSHTAPKPKKPSSRTPKAEANTKLLRVVEERDEEETEDEVPEDECSEQSEHSDEEGDANEGSGRLLELMSAKPLLKRKYEDYTLNLRPEVQRYLKLITGDGEKKPRFLKNIVPQVKRALTRVDDQFNAAAGLDKFGKLREESFNLMHQF